MATHSSILAWKIPWTEDPGRPRSIGLQRVGRNWARMPSQLTNNVVTVSREQRRDSALHIHVSISPQTPLPSRLPNNTERSSMCFTVGSCGLSTLNIAVWKGLLERISEVYDSFILLWGNVLKRLIIPPRTMLFEGFNKAMKYACSILDIIMFKLLIR